MLELHNILYQNTIQFHDFLIRKHSEMELFSIMIMLLGYSFPDLIKQVHCKN